MGIFRRGSKDTSAKPSSGISSTEGQNGVVTDESADADLTGQADLTKEAERTAERETSDATVSAATPPATSRSDGPFDRSEVGGLEGRLDLGALWLTGLPGMELRVEVEEESEKLVGVTAVLGESAVQLQAFAAPRSQGIWEDIRAEIAASITSQGGTADKTYGPLGAELQVQMPSQGPDGRPVFSPVRFVGIDGPRWFLRAVLTGPAAIDESAASAMLDVVKATVVVRGDEAMAPRELLPLKLPEIDEADQEAADQDVTAQAGADEDNSRATPSLDDLKPFERGPEITEIH